MTQPYPGTHPHSGEADTGATSMGGAVGDGSPQGEGSSGVGGRSLSSLGELIGDISKDLSTLIQQETALAKAELSASAKRGGKGAGLLGGAGVAGHFVLLFLSIALWWGLGNATGYAWSALIVALLWAVVAAVLAVLGRKELDQIKGIPQTTAAAKEIPDALKGNEESR